MTKTDVKQPMPDMDTIPVTTMVDVPVLDDEARAELIASLREAEEDIKAGRSKRFGPGEFETWLSARAAEIRAKKNPHGV